MILKKAYCLIGLILPITAMATLSPKSIKQEIVGETRFVPFTSNHHINTNPSIKCIKDGSGSNSEYTDKVSPLKTRILTEETNPVNEWPVQIRIKGLCEEVPYAEPTYYNATSCGCPWDYYMDGDVMTVMIPEWKNDIVITYAQCVIVGEFEGEPMWVNKGEAYFIIEDVEVGPNTPLLEADIAQCKPIPLELKLGDGQQVNFPTMKWDGNDFVETEKGNVVSGALENVLYNSEYNFRTPMSLFSPMPSNMEGFENIGIEFWQTKVNQVSDKWVFAYSATLMDEKDNTSMFAWLLTPNTERVSFSKEDYSQIPWSFYVDPKFPLKGVRCMSYYSISDSFWMYSTMGHGSDFLTEDKVDFYMANKDLRVNNTSSDWDLSFVYSAATEVVIDEEWGDFRLSGIFAPNYMLHKDGGVYMAAPTLFATKPFEVGQSFSSRYDEANWGVPEFNFNETQQELMFNASAPYVVTYFDYEGEPDSDRIKMYYPESAIYGMAGESRNGIDWNKQKYTVTFNGEPVTETGVSIFDFIYDWVPYEKGEGLLTIEATLETDLYLDGIQAKNTRVISFNQGAKDWNAPTLTCLQPRNNNNVVTNKFESASEGHFLMSASDIYSGMYWQYFEDWDFWNAYTWDEIIYGAEVKVEVSPCGEDQWQEIEAVATGQKNPTLGDFYDVSLGQVTSSSDNGWYDLRITVTDKTGNSQQQTITPSFYVENQTTGIITDQTNRSSDVKAIYNISGNKLSSMQPGLNIVVYSDGTCKKVLVK